MVRSKTGGWRFAAVAAILLVGSAGSTDSAALGIPVQSRVGLDDLVSAGDDGKYVRGILPAAGTCASLPHRPVSLPADDAPHSRDAQDYWEWWYWTGHLRVIDEDGSSGKQFAFAIVFESKPYLHIQQVAHTLHDFSEQKMHYDRAWLLLGDPEPTTNGFSLHAPHASAIGGNGHDRLHQEVDGYELDIALDSTKPAVLQFDDGYASLDCQNAFYYQRQRMEVEGTLVKDGARMRVTGLAWAEHQWGFTPGYQAAESEYLAFQLDDGSDIFLASVHVPPSVESMDVPEVAGVHFGSISDASGRVTMLHPDDFTLAATDYFRPSPTCSYPIAFDVVVKGRHLEVTPSLIDAEFRSTGGAFFAPAVNALWAEDATFWDGPTEISGDATGVGWLDLIRYCPGR
jgi:predicted secreted hydrolase